jgi:formylglycine-generating enzyme required for sulfatase activity
MKKLSILSNLTLITILLFSLISVSKAQQHRKENLKSFENSFIKINDTLYVDHTETTNFEYKAFINDLLLNGQTELYKLCSYDSSLWTKKFPKVGHNAFSEKNYYDQNFNSYPIVNISLKAAKAYCAWLTKKYNTLKNRSFKEVYFRLPKENEWILTSSSAPGIRLPWFGDTPYDPESLKSKGSIKSLANIKIFDYSSNENNYSFDGGVYLLPVGTYKDNPTGIYDIIGNVAEMTLEGKVKGGSWNDYIEDCYIDLSQNYEAPDPRVGFRVVMIVLEK